MPTSLYDPVIEELEAAIFTSSSRTTAPPVSGLLLVLPVRSLPGATRFEGAFLSGSSRQPEA
ncbi:hypothetical protein F2Q69_00017812 [Brassica cretica]|uniref:Uncharacterized protein n=1 Tax=Brassica cretica TaxID=69181 RepID=A0A8S9R7T7_BRACR|nr:hypothetical protein F2Q69_00017812 [Brassica cretica]